MFQLWFSQLSARSKLETQMVPQHCPITTNVTLCSAWTKILRSQAATPLVRRISILIHLTGDPPGGKKLPIPTDPWRGRGGSSAEIHTYPRRDTPTYATPHTPSHLHICIFLHFRIPRVWNRNLIYQIPYLRAWCLGEIPGSSEIESFDRGNRLERCPGNLCGRAFGRTASAQNCSECWQPKVNE